MSLIRMRNKKGYYVWLLRDWLDRTAFALTVYDSDDREVPRSTVIIPDDVLKQIAGYPYGEHEMNIPGLKSVEVIKPGRYCPIWAVMIRFTIIRTVGESEPLIVVIARAGIKRALSDKSLKIG